MSHILIVDDDESILESLEFLLKDAGYQVSLCSDGTNIKANFPQGTPDLIVLDYWLPDTTGGDLTRQLKNNRQTSHIPVIIISAGYNVKDLVVESGADAFLPKPYDIDQLLSIVAKHTIN
jgi:DNA-binding response OmpR family regulator